MPKIRFNNISDETVVVFVEPWAGASEERGHSVGAVRRRARAGGCGGDQREPGNTKGLADELPTPYQAKQAAVLAPLASGGSAIVSRQRLLLDLVQGISGHGADDDGVDRQKNQNRQRDSSFGINRYVGGVSDGRDAEGSG